ncbi:MAG: SGNH/GDSL hydrolase family protein [Lachnospiraceae bacterium]|jgi:acyl-CoA thioesterase-1
MGTIVFLGDSITDADRLNSPNGLGYGYVNQIAGQLQKTQTDWTFINKGVDGFITARLMRNLPTDCLVHHPDYICILVGINDIGLIMNTVSTEEDKLRIFEDCLRAYHQLLFDITQNTDARIITMEPFLFPWPAEYANWLPWRQKFSKQVHKLSRNYGAEFIYLHDRLNETAQKQGYDKITTDGIHLTEAGHQILADAVLEILKK